MFSVAEVGFKLNTNIQIAWQSSIISLQYCVHLFNGATLISLISEGSLVPELESIMTSKKQVNKSSIQQL